MSERDRTFAVMRSLGLELWHDSCNNMPMLLKVGLFVQSYLLILQWSACIEEATLPLFLAPCSISE